MKRSSRLVLDTAHCWTDSSGVVAFGFGLFSPPAECAATSE